MNVFLRCKFTADSGAGISGKSILGSGLADAHMLYNRVEGKGGDGYRRLELERGAGFQIVGNVFTNASAIGNLMVRGYGATNVCDHFFDGTGLDPEGGTVSSVDIENMGGWGTLIFYGDCLTNSD